MGKIDKILGTCKLPERDDHNCRVFVDMAENVHFHYREHRIVFSTTEFYAFSKAIVDGAIGLKFQEQAGYKEDPDNKEVPTKILGGSQTEDIMDVPKPAKRSAYFDDRFQIEKQVDGYGDVIHLHYRDYRLVIRKFETWRLFCETVAEAWKNTRKEFFKE